ncbi:MAG: two-component system sensor histidine kinase NtrB [Fimbriiglobus sp.]
MSTQREYLELAELAGGFVHEMKNHLNTLSLNLQLLGEDFENPTTPLERKTQARVQKLNNECQRLVDLSNDFLRFARTAEMNLVPSDLCEVVSRMVDFLTPTARAQGIDIDWYPVDLPLVMLDAEMFEKVLLNLLLNAEDAMPEGGRLTLQTRALADAIELDIIDTGEGIPEGMLHRIFLPFVTTKSEGTGLGLPTSRKIVEAHGGTMAVQSSLGHGTKFTIRLPLTPSASAS